MTTQAILSQEEIEALLELVHTSGEAGLAPLLAGAPDDGSDIAAERRDFSKPEALPRAELEFYWSESGHSATRVAEHLSRWLRVDVKVECMSIEPALYATFLGGLAAPCLVYELRAGAGGLQPAALSFDPSLALAIVDRVLGGTGRARFASRILTNVEQTQARHLAQNVVRAAADGLAEVLPLHKEVVSGPAMTARGSRYLAGDTPVLVATYSIAGDLAETEMRLVVPAAAFPRREAVASKGASGAPLPALPSVSVRVTARLGEASISMRELMNLELGDVIALDTEIGTPITLEAEGRPIAHGGFGSHGQKLAVSIEQVLRPDAPNAPQNP